MRRRSSNDLLSSSTDRANQILGPSAFQDVIAVAQYLEELRYIADNMPAIISAANSVVANTIFVQEDGNNANPGTSWGRAVRHIERALELASARNVPTLIEWGAERDVVTQGHLDMPDDCIIRSAHRSVTIKPAAGNDGDGNPYYERNVFRMGSGCFVEGLLIEGFQVDSLSDPTSGFAFSFRPGSVITRVPYVHKCAVRTPRTWGLVVPPLDRTNGNPMIPRGGGVVLADGEVCSQYSVFPNIMTWGATPVAHNGIGYCAKSGGLINAVNAVSMWAHKHFMAKSGGQIILSACSTQFGDWSLSSDGYRNIIDPVKSTVPLVVDVDASTAILANQAAIIDNMWNALVAGGWSAFLDPGDETFTRNDAALLLQCLRWTLESANEQPMLDFAKGLFDVTGTPVFPNTKLNTFLFSFDHMRDSINALIQESTRPIVTELIAALKATLSDPTPITRKDPSRITAIGHTWTAVMSGVALAKIPPANNQTSILDSIQETNEGLVIASGQDDIGNAIFVGGLEINADTGELGGPPFDQAVRRVALKAALAGSF